MIKPDQHHAQVVLITKNELGEDKIYSPHEINMLLTSSVETRLIYTHEINTNLWFRNPVVITTNYLVHNDLVGVILSKELSNHNIMLVANMFYSIFEPILLNITLYNLNERSFVLRKDQNIGTIVRIGR